MKPRFKADNPLPKADTLFYMVFNIMAEKVQTMGSEFKVLHGDVAPDDMDPEERKEYDWLVATWANVRLNALYILSKEKGIDPK